jgi:teichoic acid transport system permease protein
MSEPTRSAELEELRPVLSRQPLDVYLKELWDRREFILTVPRNKLRSQHMDTVLGNFWYLLNPALQTLVYFFVFGVLFDAKKGIPNYLAYLVIGVLTFTLIGQATTSAARCIVSNKSLIRSLYFPRAAIPITSAIASIYAFLPGVGIMLVVAAIGGDLPSLRWLLLPVVLAITVVWLLGMVFIMARLGRALPDLHALLRHLIRLLFYLSGVLFDPSKITENATVLLAFDLNPFFQLLSAWRWVIIDRPMPGWFWASLTAWAVVTLVVGFTYFWRAETTYGSER